MTEGQRDYLSDLAAKKNVRLEDTSNVSSAWASLKIEELKAMPDYNFNDLSEVENKNIISRINIIIGEVSKWNFQA